jgi:hypothetical protein
MEASRARCRPTDVGSEHIDVGGTVQLPTGEAANVGISLPVRVPNGQLIEASLARSYPLLQIMFHFLVLHLFDLWPEVHTAGKQHSF